MWRIPLPLFAGNSGIFTTTFTADEYIGDLFQYLGQPTGPVTVNFTADGVDLGEIIITNEFQPGSTFTFNAINGGRIVGEGGNGGDGGADFGASGDSGTRGQDGTPAIRSNGFNVNVNVDAGFLLGGGGGGGGGAYTNTDPILGNGDAGGGGGGGQGWSGGVGGSGGNPSTGFPGPTDGGDGTRVGPGGGGDAGGVTAASGAGGDGGIWGAGGDTGRSSVPGLIGGSFVLIGGIGGQAGEAFLGTNGATINLTGSKSEATLRSEGRIKGETAELVIDLPNNYLSLALLIMGDTNITVGSTFRSDGDLAKIDSRVADVLNPEFWLNGTLVGVGSNYDIRRRGLSQDGTGTWFTAPAETTWTSLSTNQGLLLQETYPASVTATALVEIRRADLPAGSDTNEHLASIFVGASVDSL